MVAVNQSVDTKTASHSSDDSGSPSHSDVTASQLFVQEQQSSDPKSPVTVRSLELGLRENPIRNANNVVDLIHLVHHGDAETSKAIHATRRALINLEKNAVSETFCNWLSAQRDEYASALLSLLRTARLSAHHDAAIASAALTHPSVFRAIVLAVLSDDSFLATPLTLTAIQRFPDLAYIVFRLLSDAKVNHPSSTRIRLLLAACEAKPDNPPARSPILANAYRRAIIAAWMSLLHDSSLTSADRLTLVTKLPTHLIPYMSDPLRLADFLTACYDSFNNDRALSLAALDGLFILISKHGLDYPRFYHKLYALMSHDAISHASEHHRFLELTTMFLARGTRLPGAMVAAFIKRLVRRATTVPTGSALWCLRLALELLRNNPNLSYLVHRSVNLFENIHAGNKRKRCDVNDPFDDTESDPEKCNADQSSLWELDILSSHFSPAVSRLVILFSTDVRRKPPPLPGSVQDYAALSFSDILQAEFKRKARTYHVAYDTPGFSAHSTLLKEKLASVSWT